MNFFILLATVLSQLGGSFADRFVSNCNVMIFADIFIFRVYTSGQCVWYDKCGQGLYWLSCRNKTVNQLILHRSQLQRH